MIISDFLQPEPEPNWISQAVEGRPILAELLQAFFQSRVVYYPGSGLDGHPVSVFNRSRSAHCYVYADYGIRKEDLIEEIEERGFCGYAPERRIDLLMTDFGSGRADQVLRQGSPRHGPAYDMSISPYGFLQVFRREGRHDASHGTNRFVILFLFADGHAAYEALFCHYAQCPPFAVVLQDHGFGGNWSPFGEQGQLHRIAITSGVLPRYLLVARNTTPWNGYVQSRGPDEEFLDPVQATSYTHQRFLYEREIRP
jgi:hypothetical protein